MCGLGNEGHQKRFLSEPDLTLDKALVLAQSLETADANAKTLRGHNTALRCLSQGSSCQHSAPSRGKARPSSQQRGRECYRCGSGEHLAANCRFAEFVCRNCNNNGHLARVCHSAKSQSGSQKMLGALPVQVAYGTQVKDLPLVIVQGGGPALLGRDWLGHIKLDWPVIAYHIMDKLELEGTLQRYQEVFRNELDTTKTPAVSLTLKHSSQPRTYVPGQCLLLSRRLSVGRSIGWRR